MIRVYKSDTGQFVLLHYPSQTVIVDEQLEPAFEKMQLFVKEHHPEFTDEINRPFDPKGGEAGPASASAGLAGKIALLALVMLPFLWLVSLHYTMAGVVGDIMVRFDDSLKKTDEVREKRLKDVQSALSTLREEVATLRASGIQTNGAAGLEERFQAVEQSLGGVVRELDEVRNEISALKNPPPAQ